MSVNIHPDADSGQGPGRVLKTVTALRFAKSLVRSRGRVSAHEVSAMRNAGFSDPEIAELTARLISRLPRD